MFNINNKKVEFKNYLVIPKVREHERASIREGGTAVFRAKNSAQAIAMFMRGCENKSILWSIEAVEIKK